ncbi:MAG: hypothetical protein WKF37_15725 [Bryobacteraceae bacterium]
MERSGDFSQTVNAQGNRIVIYDPLTGAVRTPFAGNVIPADRISPVARKLLELYPAANNNRVSGNLVLSSSRLNTTDTFDTRLDHNFTSTDRIMGRVSIQNPRTGAEVFAMRATLRTRRWCNAGGPGQSIYEHALAHNDPKPPQAPLMYGTRVFERWLRHAAWLCPVFS